MNFMVILIVVVSKVFFNPCCPWWDQSKWKDWCWAANGLIKPTVSPAKKNAARIYRNYLDEAYGGLYAASIPTCGASIFAPYAFGLGCITAGAGMFMADRMGKAQEKIINDPWDDSYYQPYDGCWDCAVDEQYAPYTGDPDVDTIIYSKVVGLFYIAFIYVSVNRSSTCYGAGADCGGWQADRANWFTATSSMASSSIRWFMDYCMEIRARRI
jgi:hypothetical protein